MGFYCTSPHKILFIEIVLCFFFSPLFFFQSIPFFFQIHPSILDLIFIELSQSQEKKLRVWRVNSID